ncbi:alpha/beta-hydrolase [Hypoxylon trugodes]|uniref:alpha/beta-hydrolase n=1 Tax=Hypoxylon trugodes TaxID=326681 RepID=UPI002195249D|nr:alpha/beta-hydrolase [Hypoxylon trugodes]KAI1392077.1 alpha/beta-hydrolase [Hypoxylon trugodes]
MASSGFITTPDGIRLSYTQTGPVSAPNLVFIAGWVQTASIFHKQVSHFSSSYRVTTYDHRGHGNSDKPNFGYRVYRLAADLESLLTQLDIQDAVLVGHSMGSSVLWAHWDIYSHERVKKLVFIDEARTITMNPNWTPEQTAEAGAVMPPQAKFDLLEPLRGPHWKEAWTAFSRGFFSDDINPEELKFALDESMKSPPSVAAAMMNDHASIDWEDIFPRITAPTLVIGAKASRFPVESIQWIAKQIPNSRLEIFEKEEGGSHFMFFENPEKFNRILDEFLSS